MWIHNPERSIFLPAGWRGVLPAAGHACCSSDVGIWLYTIKSIITGYTSHNDAQVKTSVVDPTTLNLDLNPLVYYRYTKKNWKKKFKKGSQEKKFLKRFFYNKKIMAPREICSQLGHWMIKFCAPFVSLFIPILTCVDPIWIQIRIHSTGQNGTLWERLRSLPSSGALLIWTGVAAIARLRHLPHTQL